jgi:RimJ/RimL family protein N-acetyltransferase
VSASDKVERLQSRPIIVGLLAMLRAAEYSAVELLRNGRRVEIRALKPNDRTELVAAVESVSPQSLYRRFLTVKRGLTEQEIDFFLNIDFVTHVALVAVMEEGGKQRIVGGGRYVVLRPDTAELAFAVVDEYQGQGICAALMRHLSAIAREAGLRELVAEVLPDNFPMLRVLDTSGLRLTTKRESQVVHVALQLSQ